LEHRVGARRIAPAWGSPGGPASSTTFCAQSIDTPLADRSGVTSSPDLFLLTAAGDILNRIPRFVLPSDLADFLEAGLKAPEAKRSRNSGLPWVKSFAEAEDRSKGTHRPLFIYVWNYG